MKRVVGLLILSMLLSCASVTDAWKTAPSCQPVVLSSSLDFQLVRWSRGADDRQRERIRLCDNGSRSRSCTDVVEYEAGWLPRFDLTDDVLGIEVPGEGVKILATDVTTVTSGRSAKLDIRISPIPATASLDQAELYERRYGLNKSPNYDLAC